MSLAVQPSFGRTAFGWLNAVVIAAPLDDALLDGFGFEVLGKGLADEGGEFGVGGESESGELFDGEFVDVGAVFGWKKCAEAEAFFEADDAVLDDKSAVTEAKPHYHEDQGHDDPPEMGVLVARPVMHCYINREDEVQQEHGQDEEVIGRIEAAMVLEVLRSRHWSPLRASCADGPQHTIFVG